MTMTDVFNLVISCYLSLSLSQGCVDLLLRPAVNGPTPTSETQKSKYEYGTWAQQY